MCGADKFQELLANLKEMDNFAPLKSSIIMYSTHTLRNGLRVIHLHDASPVIYCGLAVSAGSRDEREGDEGLAHFFFFFTFKGTNRRRAWHVLNCLERVGGDLNAFTNKEETVYYAAILREHLPRAVDLLVDIVLHSTYPQAEIDREVEVICDEIESYHDSPAELIYDEFDNLLFRGHPLGHNVLGTAERVRSFTTEDARRFADLHYRPENMVFFAYGDIRFQRLVQLLERATSDWPETLPHLSEEVSLPLPASPAGRFEQVRHTHQAHVMTGCRAYAVHSDRRIPLYLLNNMLGGPGMNARLNLSLRERHGLVYTVESSMVSYGDTGAWSVYYGCDHHHVERCLRLVERELRRVTEHPLTDSQLAAAKRQLKGQIGIANDARESFALSFAKSYLHYGWERDVERLYANIDAVTASQIQEVAAELFAPEKLTTLVFS